MLILINGVFLLISYIENYVVYPGLFLLFMAGTIAMFIIQRKYSKSILKILFVPIAYLFVSLIIIALDLFFPIEALYRPCFFMDIMNSQIAPAIVLINYSKFTQDDICARLLYYFFNSLGIFIYYFCIIYFSLRISTSISKKKKYRNP